MSERKPCPSCGECELYRSATTGANGGYGPSLLQGLGGWFHPALMRVEVCKSCGLMQFFAEHEARARLGNPGNGWRAV